MRVYQGNGFDGSTIVGYGVSLKVHDGNATVEYNDLTEDYFEALKTGRLSSRTESVQLNSEQRAWLEDSRTWVKHQLEDQ